jgi:hypothetical protein
MEHEKPAHHEGEELQDLIHVNLNRQGGNFKPAWMSRGTRRCTIGAGLAAIRLAATASCLEPRNRARASRQADDCVSHFRLPFALSFTANTHNA